MNEGVEAILTYLLTDNIVLTSFLGVTLLITGTEGARASLRSALIYGSSVLVASLVGAVVAYTLPAQEVLAPLVFLVVSLAAIIFVRSTGRLQEERFGLPAPLFALPLFFGAQYVLYDAHYDFAMTVAAALGIGLGVYGVYVLGCSMHEQSRLSETSSPVKGLPALVLALGILGFAVMGFQLL
ncbi:MAG: hypothetical protein ACOCRN_01625 [Spirochaetia bacterium]